MPGLGDFLQKIPSFLLGQSPRMDTGGNFAGDVLGGATGFGGQPGVLGVGVRALLTAAAMNKDPGLGMQVFNQFNQMDQQRNKLIENAAANLLSPEEFSQQTGMNSNGMPTKLVNGKQVIDFPVHPGLQAKAQQELALMNRYQHPEMANSAESGNTAQVYGFSRTLPETTSQVQGMQANMPFDPNTQEQHSSIGPSGPQYYTKPRDYMNQAMPSNIAENIPAPEGYDKVTGQIPGTNETWIKFFPKPGPRGEGRAMTSDEAVAASVAGDLMLRGIDPADVFPGERGRAEAEFRNLGKPGEEGVLQGTLLKGKLDSARSPEEKAKALVDIEAYQASLDPKKRYDNVLDNIQRRIDGPKIAKQRLAEQQKELDSFAEDQKSIPSKPQRPSRKSPTPFSNLPTVQVFEKSSRTPKNIKRNAKALGQIFLQHLSDPATSADAPGYLAEQLNNLRGTDKGEKIDLLREIFDSVKIPPDDQMNLLQVILPSLR